VQAYFRVNAENVGRFGRTGVVVEEGASVSSRGRAARLRLRRRQPAAALWSEITSKKEARCRYTTIQNWSTDVYNLVTKRAICVRRGDHGHGLTAAWVHGRDEVSGR
jgi:Fe-S cluster assembly protein SufB